MMIDLNEDGRRKLHEICTRLGTSELLGQLTEELGEAIQAAQKVRRALSGTTPVSLDDALVHLSEECADVAVCIDALIDAGLMDENGLQFVGRYKIDRWYRRVVSENEAQSGNFKPWEERYGK